MNKLEQEIQKEVTSLINSTDWEGLNEAAKSCTAIAIEQMGKFAEFCSDNTYQFMSDSQWLDFEGKTIFTDELINLYIKSIK